jgi:hypothetical protein
MTSAAPACIIQLSRCSSTGLKPAMTTTEAMYSRALRQRTFFSRVRALWWISASDMGSCS